MTEHHLLPRDDQPGDYTGCWNRLHVSHVFPDTAGGVWHLELPEAGYGSYCTRFNPVWRIKLAGAHISCRKGGTATIGPEGVTIGQLVKHVFNPWKFDGAALAMCPDCLCMARAAAELLSQRKYETRRLLEALDALERTEVPPA